ncbi:MAG: cold-shock protein [Brevundimonas sp.]
MSRDDREPKVFVHVKEVHKIGLEGLEKGLRFSFEIAPDAEGRPGAVRLVPLPPESRPASRR